MVALAPSRGAVCVGLMLAFAAPAQAERGAGLTALEAYVSTPEPDYQYTLQSVDAFPGFTVYTLLMDSLRWRSAGEVDRSLWSHQVIVVVPDVVSSDTALLLINGGSDPTEPVDTELFLLAAGIATASQSILAGVLQIPNQPLRFADQGTAIREDALVAYSWDKAMRTGDASWAAYFPMTKASVLAMDAVQSFVADTLAGLSIDEFVVTGFSKRGATAWLVAAVDSRVRAVAPGVFDILDMPVQIERHWQAYGFYAPAIHDYVDYDIVRRVRSPEGQWLKEIVDPYSYRALLDLPKLIISSTGDQFFLPDASRFYVDGLPGETLLLQLPNTDHGLSGGEALALNSLLAWYRSVLADTPRPVIDWHLDESGVLEVSADQPALTASLWRATNTVARDFRLESLGPEWVETPLDEVAPATWRVTLSAPPAGWTGHLVSLSFTGVGGPPAQTYTTPVFVLPDTVPFVLDEPALAPQVARFWRCQLPGAPSAHCPRMPQYPVATLESLLRIPLFGDYVTDLADLAPIMTTGTTQNDRARRHCMATRLNIAAGEFGWYTASRSAGNSESLWQTFTRAEYAYAQDDPVTAAHLCASLNRSPSAPLLPR